MRDEIARQCRMLRIPVQTEVFSGSGQARDDGRSRDLADADVAIGRTLPGIIPPNTQGNITKIALDIKTVSHTSQGGGDNAFGKKYDASCGENVVKRNAVNGFLFQPFIVGCSGGMPPSTYDTIVSISHAAAESPGRWQNRQPQLLRFMLMNISVRIAMSVAENIVTTVSQLRPLGRHGEQDEDATINAFQWVTYSTTRP